MCRNVGRLLGLVTIILALAGCQWFDSAGSGDGGRRADGTRDVNCDGHPQWKAGGPYSDGDLVQSVMRQNADQSPGDMQVHLFQCLVAGWCEQEPYEPGLNQNWSQGAWSDQGLCSNENKLIVKFPAAVAEPPATVVRKPQGIKPKEEALTGRLQCGGVEYPVEGQLGGEPVTVSGMKRGKCVLIMEAGQDALPMNTPVVFDYPDDKGSSPEFDLKYRRRHDPSRLVAWPGMKVEPFAAGLDQPRQMALNKDGTVLFVGTSAIRYWVENKRFANVIYALELDPTTGRPTKTFVVDAGLEEPHGVAYRDGALYYSTVGALYRIKDIDNVYRNGLVATREKIFTYPADDVRFSLVAGELDGVREQHQKHPLYFNPDDPTDPYLYTAVGTPCNVCQAPEDDRYGTVFKINLDTGAYTLLAKGVRNSIGYDFNPADGRIWFTDNNRQASNVDAVENSDELNYIDNMNVLKDFGAPHVFGTTVPGYSDKEWAERRNLSKLMIPRGGMVGDQKPGEISPRGYVVPGHVFQPSSAPIGARFWRKHAEANGDQNMLVALHGPGTSERRAQNLVMATIRGTKVVSVVPAVTGWAVAEGGNDMMCLGSDLCLGRPTDLFEMPDGSMLVSDDVAGVIYRLSYSAEGLPTTRMTVRMPVAPAPAVAKELITVQLINAEGVVRDMSVPWEGVLDVAGLPEGSYRLELGRTADGAWVPTKRRHDLTLASGGAAFELDAAYIARPTDLAVPMRLKAPAKPAGALASEWQVAIIADSGQEQTVAVPWGGDKVVELNYGGYQVRYPYTEKAYPAVQMDKVEIEENIPEFEKTTAYVAVPSLGQHMLERGSCTSFHSVDFWTTTVDPFKWDNAGIEALKGKIMSMRVEGHCDSVCAGEIGTYLLQDVWSDSLGSGKELGPRQVRLLARQEFANSVRDILGADLSVDALPPDQSVDEKFLYVAEAKAGVLPKDRVRKFYYASLALVEGLDETALGARYGTDSDTFVTHLGRLMLRRSLTEVEKDRYKTVYDSPEEGGVRNTVLAMLSSPYFLYRSELGQPKSGVADVYELTGPERATSLAYTLWGTAPDAALLDKAEGGGLATAEQMKAEATAMLADPRAAEQMARFISYFMGVSPTTTVSVKEGLPQPVVDAMRQEVSKTVEDVFKSDDSGADSEASVYRVFNPEFTYLNKALADHYGIAGGPAGDQLVKVPLTGDNVRRRGGPLNSGLFATAYSGESATSIITRGFRIRQHMYCQVFQGNADRESDGIIPNDHPISERQKWDIYTGEAATGGKCWTCHKFFNDTGASLENYDQLGKYRLTATAVNTGYTDTQLDIDASGPFVSSTTGLWIPNIQDVRDIANNIPRNEVSLSCFAQGYYRFALGARTDGDSYAAVKRMTGTLTSNGSKFKRMMAELMASGVMLERKNPTIAERER